MKHRAGRGRIGPINSDGHAIGLDLGATSVRAAVLSLTSANGYPAVTVNGMGSLPLPPGAVVNGMVVEEAVVTAALKQLWEVNDFSCRNVILGVANPQVVVRPLQMPQLTEQQRAKALPFQAREIIALPLDEVLLDYAQVGAPDPETGLLSGLLIATPRKPVLAAVNAVERAGLRVGRVDLSSFGALRSIADDNLTVQAVVDLGAHLTTIVIHNHGVPQLVRTVARGGQELTDQLMDNLGLSFGDAEKAKSTSGLADQRDTVSTTVANGVRPLLAEIRSSINYFRSSSDGGRLEGIALTGGGSALPGLAETLSNQNGVPVRVIPPMQHVRDTGGDADVVALRAERYFRDASAVSVGLAMGAAA